MKRIAFLTSFSLTLFFLSGSVVQSAQSGDLISCPDTPAVYYLDNFGKRWVFPNDKTYFSWYPGFENVVQVSCTELSSYPLGKLATYQAGTRLVKIQSDPKVYAVEPNGVLRWIQTEAQALALYGSDWAMRIDDVPVTFWSSYTIGVPLGDNEVPRGSVVYDSADNIYYYAKSGQYRKISMDFITKVLRDNALGNRELLQRLSPGDPLPASEWTQIQDLSNTQAPPLSSRSPDAPVITNLTTQATRGQEFEISWTAPTGALTYTVEKDSNSNFSFPQTIYTGPLTTITHTINEPNVTISYFRVKAENGIGSSGWSFSKFITITPYLFISNVPDGRQPPTQTLNFSNIDSWSGPTVAAALVYYYDRILNHSNAIGLTGDLSVENVSEYIGWYLATNGLGSRLRKNALTNLSGTVVSDIPDGLLEFIQWDGKKDTQQSFGAPIADMNKKGFENWKAVSETGIDKAAAFNNAVASLNKGQPVLLVFKYWNPISLNFYLNDISLHRWGSTIDTASQSYLSTSKSKSIPREDWSSGNGHAVLAVGYIKQHDINDGLGPRDWIIVLDTWGSSDTNIAVPWENWQASIFITP